MYVLRIIILIITLTQYSSLNAQNESRSISIAKQIAKQGPQDFKYDNNTVVYIQKSSTVVHKSLTENQSKYYSYVNKFEFPFDKENPKLELKCKLIGDESPMKLEIGYYEFNSGKKIYPYHTSILIDDLVFDEQDRQNIRRALEIWLYAWFRIEALSQDFHRALNAFENEMSTSKLKSLASRFKAFTELANNYYDNYETLTDNAVSEKIFNKQLEFGYNFIVIIQAAILKSQYEYKDLKKRSLEENNLDEMIAAKINYLTLNEHLYDKARSVDAVKNIIAACSTLSKLYQRQGNTEKMKIMNDKHRIWGYVLEEIIVP